MNTFLHFALSRNPITYTYILETLDWFSLSFIIFVHIFLCCLFLHLWNTCPFAFFINWVLAIIVSFIFTFKYSYVCLSFLFCWKASHFEYNEPFQITLKVIYLRKNLCVLYILSFLYHVSGSPQCMGIMIFSSYSTKR